MVIGNPSSCLAGHLVKKYIKGSTLGCVLGYRRGIVFLTHLKQRQGNAISQSFNPLRTKGKSNAAGAESKIKALTHIVFKTHESR